MDTKAFLDNLIKRAERNVFSSVPVISISDQTEYEDTWEYLHNNEVLHTVEHDCAVRFKHEGMDYSLIFSPTSSGAFVIRKPYERIERIEMKPKMFLVVQSAAQEASKEEKPSKKKK
jgi:hypothetical protein